MLSNKKIGNDFETELCELLADKGYWAHNMTQNASGQPADIIACNKKQTVLIDCKVCSDDRFRFSRIEDNQHMAMKTFDYCSNNRGWFAIKFEKTQNVYMLSYFAISVLISKKKHSITEKEFNEPGCCGYTLDEWIHQFS